MYSIFFFFSTIPFFFSSFFSSFFLRSSPLAIPFFEGSIGSRDRGSRVPGSSSGQGFQGRRGFEGSRIAEGSRERFPSVKVLKKSMASSLARSNQGMTKSSKIILEWCPGQDNLPSCMNFSKGLPNNDIWKVLAELCTKKRIILSRTPFQNNFGELRTIMHLLLSPNDEDMVLLNPLTLGNLPTPRRSSTP